MEFQAIVLAGGKGSRMSELTSNIPKCLLPIGNKPMIWYPIRMLEKAGFNEINIITFESIKSRVETELKLNHGIRASLNMYGLDDDEDDEDFGTATALNLLKDKIVKDCIVVSSDLICNVNLQLMANFYRINNASIVMLLGNFVEQNLALPVPGSNGKYSPDRDLIALDADTNRILFFSGQDDVEEDIKIKNRVFQKYPKLIWTNKLLDGHLYIIKKSLIDYIIDNKKISSLKSDFMPFVCKKQFSSCNKKVSQKTSSTNQRQTLYDYIKSDANDIHSSKSKTHTQLDQLLSCYGFVLADGFCYRANNLSIYAEANKQVIFKIMPHFQKEKTEIQNKQNGSDNIVGEGTTFGDKAIIKRCIIGKNCKISDKVKLTNSILMDNVTINEAVTIQGSIICSNSKINQKSELKDCLVGFNQDIVTAGKYSNETIQDIDSLIDD